MSRKTSDVTENQPDPQDVSRRQLLAATGVGLAALSTAACAVEDGDQAQVAGSASAPDSCDPVAAAAAKAERIANAPKAPFDSIRDYFAALDAYGLLLRIPRVDQDQYQMTGIVFRSSDRNRSTRCSKREPVFSMPGTKPEGKVPGWSPL